MFAFRSLPPKLYILDNKFPLVGSPQPQSPNQPTNKINTIVKNSPFVVFLAQEQQQQPQHPLPTSNLIRPPPSSSSSSLSSFSTTASSSITPSSLQQQQQQIDAYSMPPPVPLPSPRGSPGDDDDGADSEDIYNIEPIVITHYGDNSNNTIASNTTITSTSTPVNTQNSYNNSTPYSRDLLSNDTGFTPYSDEPFQDPYAALNFTGIAGVGDTSTSPLQQQQQQQTIQTLQALQSTHGNNGWPMRDYSDFKNCRVLCTLFYDSDDGTPVSYLKNPPIEYKAAILNQIKARGLGYTQGKDGRSIGPVMKVEVKVNVLTSKHEGMNFKVVIELVDDTTWAPIQNSRVVIPHIRVISKPEPTHIKRKYVRHKELPSRPSKKQQMCIKKDDNNDNNVKDSVLTETNSNNNGNNNTCCCNCNNNHNSDNIHTTVPATLSKNDGDNANNNICKCCCSSNNSVKSEKENHLNGNINTGSNDVTTKSDNSNDVTTKSDINNDVTTKSDNSNVSKGGNAFINETVLALLNKIEAKEDENHRTLDNLSATISRSSSLASSYFCSPVPSYVPTTSASPSLQSAIAQAVGPSLFTLADVVAETQMSSPKQKTRAVSPRTSNSTSKSDATCLNGLSVLSPPPPPPSSPSSLMLTKSGSDEQKSNSGTEFSEAKKDDVTNFCGNCEKFLDLYSKLNDSEKEGEIRNYLKTIDLDKKNRLIEFASLVLNNCLVKNDFI